jgi:hypothetical protein
MSVKRNVTVPAGTSPDTTATLDDEVQEVGVGGVDPDVQQGIRNVDIEFDLDADCYNEHKDALGAGGRFRVGFTAGRRR